MSDFKKNKILMKQFMVEIKFNKQDFPEIMPLVPEQQEKITELMQKNKVGSS